MILEVTGAIASRNGVTVFMTDGTSMVLGQDSYRTHELLQKTLIPLATNPGEPVTIELDEFAIAEAANKALAEVAPDLKIVEDERDRSLKAITAAGVEVDVTPMEEHIERVAYGTGAKGFAAFIEDFARIEHKFSADELLKFMKGNDLPIADDGSIIVFKWLTPHPRKQGVFVDTHTEKVEQRLGSRVWMPLEKANTNWRMQCASGLHVCSHGYGSYGTELFLAKVRPSDVIAAPPNERGKMRVVAYHLVAKVVGNEVMRLTTETDLSRPEYKLLANVVAGEHIRIIEHVEVGGSTVENAETPITVTKTEKPKAKRERKKAADLKVDVPMFRKRGPAPKIDPKEIKAKIKTIQDLATLRTAQGTVEERLAAYELKLAEARKMYAEKKSMREISRVLKMDRETLSKALKG